MIVSADIKPDRRADPCGFLAVMAALFWGMAVFFSVPLFEAPALFRLAALGCALSGTYSVCVLFFLRGTAWPRAGWPVLWAGLFWLVLLTSPLWSVSPFYSLLANGTFLLLPLGFLTGLLAPRRSTFWPLLAVIAAAVLTGLGIWVIAQATFLADPGSDGVIRHPYLNPNSSAAVLSLGFFAFWGGAYRYKFLDVRTFLCLAGALICLAAVVCLGSLAAIVALTGGLVLFTSLVRPWPQHLIPLGLAGLVAGIAALVPPLLGESLPLTPDAMEAAIESRSTALGASLEARLALWQATAALIADHLVRGTGFGTFFLTYPAYRLPGDPVSAGFMAHSDPLQFAAAAGLAAPVLFYAFGFACLLRFIRSVRDDPGADSGDRPLMIALFCGLAALAAHAHVSFPLAIATVLILCGLMLGLWLGLSAAGPENNSRALNNSGALPAGARKALYPVSLILPFAALLYVFQGPFISMFHSQQAAAALTANPPKTGVFARHIESARDRGFDLNPAPYVQAATFKLEILTGNPLLSREERETLAAEIETQLARADTLNARQPQSLYLRARLYQAQDRGESAAAAARGALARDPLHLPARMVLARLYRDQYRYEDAYEILKAGLPWPYNQAHNPEAYYSLTARAALEQGDTDTHQDALARMRALPENGRYRPGQTRLYRHFSFRE